uniref:Uncharacterized protein n=1 Tax=viral metagenome TaxID=1070528 RepID=A0A6C0K2Z5_9ZZZZ
MDTIKTTLFTIISDIRYFILAGFQNLPLSIAGFMIIVGFFTAHYPLLFFSIGYLVVLPAFMSGLNAFLSIFSLFQGMSSDAPACSLIPSYLYPTESTAEIKPGNDLGYWVPMTFFFIGYMITNAAMMFTAAAPVGTPNDDTQALSPGMAARKTNTAVGMAAITLLAVVVLVIRMKMCEKWYGVLLGAAVGGVLGMGWYRILMAGIPTDQRLNDMFGIASRLLVPYAVTNAPYACMPPTARN